MENTQVLLIDNSKDNIQLFQNIICKNIGISALNASEFNQTKDIINSNDICLIISNINCLSIDDSKSLARLLKINDDLLPLIMIINDMQIIKEYCCKEKIIDFVTFPSTENEQLIFSHRLSIYIESYNTKKLLQKEMNRREKLEAKYKNLIEFTNTGYMILDKNFKILEINENIEKILGFNRDDIIGSNPRSFISSKYITDFDNSMDLLLSGTIINDLELSINSPNKTSHISLNASLMINGENRILCLVRDIANRKINEENRYIAKQKQKDEFLQNIKEIRESLKKDLFKIAAL